MASPIAATRVRDDGKPRQLIYTRGDSISSRALLPIDDFPQPGGPSSKRAGSDVKFCEILEAAKKISSMSVTYASYIVNADCCTVLENLR